MSLMPRFDVCISTLGKVPTHVIKDINFFRRGDLSHEASHVTSHAHLGSLQTTLHAFV